MNPITRTLITVGVFLVIAGIFWQFGGQYLHFVGKMPGDITVRRGNMRIYFPVVTCIVLSLAVSLVLWVIRRIFG